MINFLVKRTGMMVTVNPETDPTTFERLTAHKEDYEVVDDLPAVVPDALPAPETKRHKKVIE